MLGTKTSTWEEMQYFQLVLILLLILVTALSSFVVPQRLEKNELNLLLFCFVCNKLRLLFLNTNIKAFFFTPVYDI